MSLANATQWLAVLAAIVTASVGIAVWFAQKHDGLRRSFLFLSLFIGLWIISNAIFGFVDDSQRYPIALISYAFAMGVAVHSLLFCLSLVMGNKLRFRRQVEIGAVGYIVGILATIPGIVAVGVSGGKIEAHVVTLGLYGVVLSVYLLAASIVLLSARRRMRYVARQQISFVLLGMVISSIAGAFFNLILPLSGEYRYVQLGPASTIIFVGVVAYVIVKHRLFDIRLAITRSIVYFLILATLASLYFGLAYGITLLLGTSLLSAGQMTINIAVALLMAAMLQPLKRFFDRFTNRAFYRDNYITEDFIRRLSRTLTSTTDLRGLLQRASNEVSTTLKADHASFYIHSQDDRYVSAGTEHYQRLPKADAQVLDEHMQMHDDAIVVTDLLPVHNPIRRLLKSHKAALVLSLRQGNDNVGYLFLGDKKAAGYTQRDLQVLITVRDELVIAIQNALSIQEFKNLNETLQQRVNEATKELRASNAQLQRLDKAKDEFVGMASHQLRTPLTSVKGYISMVIEGDAGKITDAQRHLLDEAFTSSERMVHLINDFLNVSRLQTGKFLIDKRPTQLAKVIEQELDSLATTAASRNLTFLYKPPEDFPLLDLDESKIRQVIMNFADNALYYSPEHTNIHVKLMSEGGEAIFTVKDAGIGVPVAEQSQLFSKFYRASNARKQRPDGTGVGLYLAKKVVDAHGGKVIFESAEGQGSTFGFRLPLDKSHSIHHANELEQ